MPNRSLKTLLFLCVIALIAATTACAHAAAPYELRIENASGERLRTFPHRGQLFALGRVGQRYNLRVYNHSGARIEAVVSVDGRDVLTGQPGDFRNQRGYIVEAYGEVLIEGFRQSLSEVASFRFTSPGDSYSSRMGSPENVGVIGLAVFDELRRPLPPPVPYYGTDDGYDYEPSSRGGEESRAADKASASSDAKGAPSAGGARGRASSPAAEASASAPARREQNRIGTQYGESRYSAVHETSFERASPARPNYVTTLRYDDRAGLIARGIEVEPPRPRPVQGPSAFPMSRFAPPPPEAAWR